MKITASASPLMQMTPPEGTPDHRPGFADNLKESIKKVNTLQADAHKAMEDLAVGKSNNIHETMIAIQKAETSFKMMMQVRNKIMNAYQEVMRMQV
jgi:flagellar hook-basal body complex protein FliE